MDKLKDSSAVKNLLKDVLQIIKDQAVLSTIERDLALEKLRQAYDLLLFEKPQAIAEDKKEIEVEKPTVITDDPKPIEVDEEIQQSETRDDEIAREELISEIELVVEQPPEIEEQKETIDETFQELSEEKEVIAEVEIQEKEEEVNIDLPETPDLFSDVSETKTQDTVVDNLNRDIQKESISDQFQKNKIELLKEAIGINEKFFFLNELFDGDPTIYNQAIDTLDNFTTADEANIFVKSLAEQNQWDEHEQARNQFLDFVDRKFTEG